MKKRTRTTEIRIEAEEFFLLGRSRKPVWNWCVDCGAVVLMVTADEAAVRGGVSTRTIYRWVEEGKVHFAETPAGKLLVCANSLT